VVQPVDRYSLVSISTSEVAVFLAVVFKGAEPVDIRPEMRAFVMRAEQRYGEILDRWSGNMAEVHGLEAMAGRLFL
jgi:hypothetical protein